VFEGHFKSLYGMKPEYDLGVLDLVQQHAMFEGLDGEPNREEIKKALKGLRVSEPGDSGASAAIWKLLLFDEECLGFVVQYVMRFWRRKACPKVWETGLLKILEKKKATLVSPATIEASCCWRSHTKSSPTS
jgi:hypothetical protein